MIADWPSCRDVRLEVVNEAGGNLGIVLVRAEEAGANHICLQADSEPSVAGHEIHSAADRECKGILAAKRSLGREFGTTDHAVSPHINLAADLQPVAYSSQSHHDGGINVALWSARGCKFATPSEVASVGVVHERHVETVQIACDAREFVEHEVRVSGVSLPVVVLEDSVHTLGSRFGGFSSGNRKCRHRRSQ